MKATINQERPRQEQVGAVQQSERSTESPESTAPLLESVVQAVCLDAQKDSLKYLLRSDTGHDGE